MNHFGKVNALYLMIELRSITNFVKVGMINVMRVVPRSRRRIKSHLTSQRESAVISATKLLLKTVENALKKG